MNRNELETRSGQSNSVKQQIPDPWRDEQEGGFFELRAALDVIDNTRHYQELLLFNRSRREDPNISPGEQVDRFKKVVSNVSGRIIGSVADAEEGDFTSLPRSIRTEHHADKKKAQHVQSIDEEAVHADQRENESGEKPKHDLSKQPGNSTVTSRNAKTKGGRQGQSSMWWGVPEVHAGEPRHSSKQADDVQAAGQEHDTQVRTPAQEHSIENIGLQ